ncbi:MAG: M23 family metallopeptidase [Verrucomicrobiota bacterium]
MIRQTAIASFLALTFLNVTFGADARIRLADGFDFPVGPPDRKGYYKARGFWPNGHLGEDWNGVGGGNTDLGDPVYSMGDGIVILSKDIRVGWGNCVIIRHAYRERNGSVKTVDSLYGHLNTRYVTLNQRVKRGQKIGTIGTNRGMYLAHLHFEVRKNLHIGMNRSSFAKTFANYHDPTKFIEAKRRCETSSRLYTVPTDNFAPYGKKLTTSQIAASKSSTSIPIDNSRQDEIRRLVTRARSSDWKPSDDSGNVRVVSRTTSPTASLDPKLQRIVEEAQRKKEAMEKREREIAAMSRSSSSSIQATSPSPSTTQASGQTAGPAEERTPFWKRFRSKYAESASSSSSPSRTRRRLFRK